MDEAAGHDPEGSGRWSARRLPPAASPWWDLVPVLVSVVASAAFIVRSSTTLGGRRAYVLFDDAAISLTYARNLAEGHGLVWNAGQHPVEGYSNLLWVLWMAVLELGRPSDELAGLWVMLSGAVLLAANTYLVARIARRLAPGSRLAPLLAGTLTACYWGLNSWTLEGMETGLVALLLSGAVLCVLGAEGDDGWSGRHLVGAGVLLGLATLTRDDALLVAALVVAYVAVRSPRRLVDASRVAVPVLLTALGHLLFRLAYYGHPLPNTYYLKLSGIPLGTRVARGAVVVAQNLTMQLVVSVLLVGAYVLLVRRSGRRVAPGAVLLLGIVGVQLLYLVYVGGDSYDDSLADRYLAAVAPFLFVVAVLGALELAKAGRAWSRPTLVVGSLVLLAGVWVTSGWLPTGDIQVPDVHWHLSYWVVALVAVGLVFLALGLGGAWRVVPGVVVVAVLVGGVLATTDGVPYATWGKDNFYTFALDNYVAAEGVQLRATTAPGTSVAVYQAGNIVFFDHRVGVDLYGYSDPVIARTTPHTSAYFPPGAGTTTGTTLPITFKPGHDKWDYDYSVGMLRPDVVVGILNVTPADQALFTRLGYRKGTVLRRQAYYLPGTFSS